MDAAFTDTGDLVHSPKFSTYATWQEVHPFTAMLTLDGRVSGGGPGYFRWKHAVSGALYPMFPTDLVDLLKNSLVDSGSVFGNWEVCKRGQAYGVRRLKSGKGVTANAGVPVGSDEGTN
jgi:hypothetical protein